MFRLFIASAIVAVVVGVGVANTASAHNSSLRGERISRLPDGLLAREARKVVRNGGTHSTRWGGCKTYLRKLSYELVYRGFSSHYRSWALYVVNRESGFCPGAINSTSGTTGLAQIHPDYHTQFNYKRMKSDPAYAVKCFLRLSHNGRYQSPWYL